MSEPRTLTYKTADQPWEFEAIHRLNYRTFVEEIPQHDPNGEQRLVDRFHRENTYIICLHGRTLAGMVALRFERPFSLDQKLPDLDQHLPPGMRWCEARLLAVDPAYRGSTVMAGMLRFLCQTVAANDRDAAVISATTRQMKLYRHLGFEAFGPLVGREGAWYQPMHLSISKFEERAPILSRSWSRPESNGTTLAANGAASLADGAHSPSPSGPVNLLPGPVNIPKVVRDAFAHPPVSHRGDRFVRDIQTLRRELCRLTGSRHVQLMLGSGSVANEAIAAQISLLDSPGIVLSNGEFSERLADQARRWQLPHHQENLPWGEAITAEKAAAVLDRHPEARWLWTTHCETSTSVLNDLAGMRDMCAERGVKLCLDCISSVGVVPVDLRGVWLASCASGKGLASYPGIALVFHHCELEPAPHRLPRYLDLGFYVASEGIPFTQSSNLLYALKASLEHTDWDAKIACVAEMSGPLKHRLEQLGCRIVSQGQPVAPAVITLELPEEISSLDFADRLDAAGFLLSCRSGYLSRRNWVQICLMGEVNMPDLDRLCDIIAADNPWQRG